VAAHFHFLARVRLARRRQSLAVLASARVTFARPQCLTPARQCAAGVPLECVCIPGAAAPAESDDQYREVFTLGRVGGSGPHRKSNGGGRTPAEGSQLNVLQGARPAGRRRKCRSVLHANSLSGNHRAPKAAAAEDGWLRRAPAPIRVQY
jgi:hypothetical protein